MTGDPDAYLTILGMALVTYLTRISGFYIAGRMSNLRPGLARTLAHIPGTIIISIIAPQILSGGIPGLIAAALAWPPPWCSKTSSRSWSRGWSPSPSCGISFLSEASRHEPGRTGPGS
nr:hypothetical protein [Desulfobacula sp.]